MSGAYLRTRIVDISFAIYAPSWLVAYGLAAYIWSTTDSTGGGRLPPSSPYLRAARIGRGPVRWWPVCEPSRRHRWTPAVAPAISLAGLDSPVRTRLHAFSFSIINIINREGGRGLLYPPPLLRAVAAGPDFFWHWQLQYSHRGVPGSLLRIFRGGGGGEILQIS